MTRKYMPILIMLLAVVTATCVAQTWDATKDFGPSNPNGLWSYGYGITGTSFTLNPIYDSDCVPGTSGVVCWTAKISDNNPNWAFNTTGGWLNWTCCVAPPDVLLTHPGPYYGQDTILQWTTPVAGYYKIAGFFEILDTNPTGIFGLVFRNGTPLYSWRTRGSACAASRQGRWPRGFLFRQALPERRRCHLLRRQ